MSNTPQSVGYARATVESRTRMSADLASQTTGGEPFDPGEICVHPGNPASFFPQPATDAPWKGAGNLARGERSLRTPGTRAYLTNPPRHGRADYQDRARKCT